MLLSLRSANHPLLFLLIPCTEPLPGQLINLPHFDHPVAELLHLSSVDPTRWLSSTRIINSDLPTQDHKAIELTTPTVSPCSLPSGNTFGNKLLTQSVSPGNTFCYPSKRAQTHNITKSLFIRQIQNVAPYSLYIWHTHCSDNRK